MFFLCVCSCVINQERPAGSEGGAQGGEKQATEAAGQWGINERSTTHSLHCLHATDYFFTFLPFMTCPGGSAQFEAETLSITLAV